MPRYYHVTPFDNLKSILAEGLKPQIGERSSLGGELEPAIYLFESLKAVEHAMMNWLGECYGEDEQVSLLAIDFLESKQANPDVEFEIVISEAIPLSLISILSFDLDAEPEIMALANERIVCGY